MKKAVSDGQLAEDSLGYLQLIPTAASAAVVTGRLDARARAAQTTACRLVAECGTWIGFEVSEGRMRALVGGPATA